MKTIFKESDITHFSLISHDCNPLHMDDLYARKTAHGQRVVFGALGALRCLELLQAGRLNDYREIFIKRLEVEFPNPILIGVEYSFRLIQNDPEIAIVELCDGKKTLVKVCVHFAKRKLSVDYNDRPSVADTSAATNIRTTPLDYQPSDFLNEIEVGGLYQVNTQFLAKRLAAYPVANVPLLPADVLMLCSFIIGMELPGAKALFSKLNLSFSETHDSSHELLRYQAVKDYYDDAYGLMSVRLNVAVGGREVVQGELKSFVRNAIVPIERAQIEALLKPAARSLAGKVALVIGGSRGLGATMVRALALSGCHVVLNFTRSLKEAQEIEREFPGGITLLQGDAGDKAWCKQANDIILKQFKRLDVLICNACEPPANLGDLSSKRARDFISRNLRLTTQPIAAFAATLKAGQGTIVGISSSIVDLETAEWPEYRETKLRVETAIHAAAKKYPQISCLIARPPALITDMSNTPIRLMNAIRPEIVGVAVVNALAGAVHPGATVILNSFAEESGRGEVEANRAKIILSATFTVTPVLESLAFWARELELPVAFEVAPYNQVFQELLSPDSLFARNASGMNAILFRFEDWLHEVGNLPSVSEKAQYLNERLSEFVVALEAFSRRALAHGLLLICPSFSDDSALQTIFHSLEQELVARLSTCKGLDALVMERYHPCYGIKGEIHDAERNELAHIPFTAAYFAAIGTTLIRRYYALIHGAYKVVVVDCDNTLWGGVCGEISPGELNLGGRFERLQNFLIAQYQQGKIICLCSKNVEVDVWNVFEQRGTMPLKRDHIVDARINWNAKSDNIRSLASSLNLGLDSFVFIDDNPVECAEVRAHCPEVLTLQMAANDSDAQHTLDHLWLLDSYAATEEDKKRSEMYKANIQRESMMGSAADFESFLKNLNLQITISTFAPEDLARISQLTQRTNQFNFTTVRRTENQIRQLSQDENFQVLAVNVNDKFGDYGLVGTVILQQSGDSLIVDSFMLSCRVLGRGVEHRMLQEISNIAADKGLATVTVRFAESEKNLPARQFLEQCGVISGTQKNFSVDIPAQQLQAIKHQPAKEKQAGDGGVKKPQKSLGGSQSSRSREQQLAKIAGLAHDIAKLYQTVSGLPQPPAASGTQPASNSLQTRLLDEVKALFGKVLAINPQEIDAEESLERYVRDSLANVELTVELRKAFGKLPATYLFEHRSIQAIADNLLATNGAQLAAKFGIAAAATQQPRTTGGNEALRDDDIAIIGMEGQFPQAETLQEFWENLVQGKECIGEIPADRWDVDGYFDPTPQPGKSYNKWGGFLTEVDRFDAALFRISPTEAELMDPQQRLLLQVVWGLLENAGYTRKTMSRKTGVFVGVNANDYLNFTNETALAGLSSYRYSDFYQLSNRISYFFDFKGPSLTLDTACSSSGTALHLACKSLLDGDCETAVIGATNLFLHPSRYIQYSQMQMLSRDSKCRPFGAGATGTVFGEGVAALLLKRLSAAERDGDPIHAIIKGSAINSGGKTNGFTVPNPQAHAELVSTALTRANIDARTISYVEAHGTGTPLGDPIEIRGLQMAFSANTGAPYQDDRQYCSLGTIKANIGHLEAAAGMAGIIKVLLQMHHRTLVPSLNSAIPNPEIPFEETPFQVQQKTAAWHRPVLQMDGKPVEIPRRAGISTFGAGGSNAHIVLEEYEMPAVQGKHDGACIVVLSALEDEQLRQSAARLAKFLEGTPRRLCDIAYTLQIGREALDKRLALVVADVPELIEKLSEYSRGGRAGCYAGATLESQNHLTRTALAWVAGKEVDWSALYSQPLPQRIPLPAHPFAGERYWVPRMNGKPTGKLHPLIDAPALGLSLGAGIVFNKRFKSGDLIVKDHQVNHQPVLPGVGYLAAVYAAAAEVVDVDQYSLEKVLWQKPLVVENGKADIHIALNRQDEQIHFEIRSAGDAVVYASGRLAPKGQPTASEPLALDEIKARCGGSFDKETIYRHFEQKGFSYGAYFQGLNHIWFNDQEALGQISLPAQFVGELEKYGLQPTLADAALQTGLHLFPKATGAMLPFSVESVERLRPLPQHGYAYARRNGNHLLVVDILDTQGELCLRFHDLALRELGDPMQRFFYAPAWKETPLGTPSVQVPATALLVYSDDSAVLKDALAGCLVGDKLLELKLGTAAWETKADDAEAIDKCIASLSAIDTIYFLGGIHGWTGDGEKSQQYGMPALFRLLKSLEKQGHTKTPLALKVVTNNVYRLREDEQTVPWSAGIFSLAKSIAGEYSQLQVAAIDIDAQDSAQYAAAIVHEAASKNVVPVLLRGGNIDPASINLERQCNLGSRCDQAPPPSRGRLGGGWGRSETGEIHALDCCLRLPPHPHPNPPLEGEGVELLRGGNIDPASISLDSRCDQAPPPSRGRLGGGWGKSETCETHALDCCLHLPPHPHPNPPLEGEGVELHRIHRYVQTVEPLTLPAAEKPVFRKNGVYLILGGAGGLGFELSRFLAQTVQGRLIWVGRRPEDEAIRTLLAQIKQLGGEAQYLAADAANPDSMARAIATARAHFGNINGAIHSAAALHDRTLANMSEQDFAAALQPKVAASIVLSDLLRDEPMDFMLFFSSVNSFTAAMGQANYSAGCCFSDAYARYLNARAKYPVKTINWGYWGGVGLAASEEDNRRMRALGHQSITPKLGMEAVQRILADARVQVIAAKADDALLAEIGVQGLTEPPVANIAAAATNVSRHVEVVRLVEATELSERALDYVKTIFERVLKIKKQKLDASSTFERFGIDSLISLQIIQAFEKDLGSLSPTLLFENIRIKELAEYLCGNHAETLKKMLTPAAVQIEPIVPPQQCAAPMPTAVQPPTPASHSADIAIIGLSGKFPMSDTLEAFWNNIRDGKNCISEIPPERWDRERHYDSAATPDSTKFRSKWGGFISDVDKFDPLFFNIAPVDAESMDPQQRLFMETAWKTMEDAGYTREQLTAIQDKHNLGIGVYVGCMYQQYPFVVDDPQVGADLSAFSYWYIPNRVSAFLNLRGPSLAVDSACSSSLTAIHMACESIKSGECLMAFAGGVNLNLHPSKYALLNRMGILGSTDRNRSLGDGDGYIPGEGVGAVLLKPLSLAVQDGDHIYAVIKGSSINHGGKTSGLTAPNPKELTKLFSSTLHKSGIDPRAINYVEVAANGSPMGDPIEIVALNNAFKAYGLERHSCALGAVKSNIGHLEGASGMSQLCKVLYQMKHKCLAPSLNAEPLNPKINLKDSCFYVQKELAEWKRPSVIQNGLALEFPRTAAITAIGAGGANAHLIVQEYEQATGSRPTTGECLIVLSARNAKGLKAQAAALSAFLNDEAGAFTPAKLDGNKLFGTVQNDLLTEMSRILGVDPAEIGTDQEFIDCGCDEIILGKLCREINQKYGLDGILNDWVENRTLENVARHLLEKNHAALAAHYDAEKGAHHCDTTAPQLTLNDIAYTLQIGREAMKERLAVVVAGKRELIAKLEQYASGETEVDSLIQGNLGYSSPLAKMMSESSEGNDFVNKIIAGGNLHEIARLWVSGIQIDWARLYVDGNKPQRKPLPTYPFARESYWAKPAHPSPRPEPVAPSCNIARTAPLPEQARRVSPRAANLLDALKDELISSIAALLKVDAGEIEADADLQEYGFDSINLASFASAINAKYQLDLTADLFLAYPTVSACAAFLLKKHHAVFAARFAEKASPGGTPEGESKIAQFPREASIKAFEKGSFDPIAIIGMSGMMPRSDDLEEYWENLKSGRNLISAMPAERWNWQAHYGQTDAKDLLWGGFLNHVDKFDNLFFALSPKEAELMDPQQRLFLQTVWSTIENAGYAVSDLAGSNTGLFVGVSCHDYEQALHKTKIKIEAHTSTSLMVHSILANRLSYLLDFHGPSEIIDTACSSSSVAVHRAIRAIHAGDSDLAIAGGVNVLIDPQGFFTLNEAGMLSTSRDVKLFHQDGKGYLRGEGVGAILLKPLSKAIADRDHIYALIKGSDVNHDGKSFSLTSPNPVAQANVVKNAYARAGVDPSTVGYIEAQGTGSQVSDQVEINAFKNAFQELYQEHGIRLNGTPHCGIGYLKPTIGHLESAYGISALIKVLLSMENHLLPASRNISEEGSRILLKNSPFYMVMENRRWERLTDRDGALLPKRAGIHSFGVGGVNAHIVLEEFLG